MTMHQWILGIGVGLLMAAFLIFASGQEPRFTAAKHGDGGGGGYAAGGGERGPDGGGH
ncbi:MAG TPA: hypothetical protein VFK79_07930 [Xanthobacteraceae bacterium]|nr:hypothetical protein [Xanthobacteraceae bacterium]